MRILVRGEAVTPSPEQGLLPLPRLSTLGRPLGLPPPGRKRGRAGTSVLTSRPLGPAGRQPGQRYYAPRPSPLRRWLKVRVASPARGALLKGRILTNSGRGGGPAPLGAARRPPSPRLLWADARRLSLPWAPSPPGPRPRWGAAPRLGPGPRRAGPVRNLDSRVGDPAASSHPHVVTGGPGGEGREFSGEPPSHSIARLVSLVSPLLARSRGPEVGTLRHTL